MGDRGASGLPITIGRAVPVAVTLVVLAGCVGSEDAGETDSGATTSSASSAAPDTVRIAEPGLHPEGVEWDADRARFLVGSVTEGTVTTVGDDGSLEELVPAVEGVGSIGIHLDRETDRLLVAYADVSAFGNPGARGDARLGIYDARTGEGRVVDLASLRSDARHFANDVTAGPDGTAYVTDSFHPVVYAVSPDGEASVLVEDERLAGDPAGLNGIDWHPDGYLLAAVMGRSAIVKIPLDAPGELTEVELPEPVSGDGLVLAPDGTLAVVGSTQGPDGPRSEVLWLTSSDGWSSAEVAARASAGGATTGAVREGSVHVVNPHFEAMGGSEPHPSFEIYRVEHDSSVPSSGAGEE